VQAIGKWNDDTYDRSVLLELAQIAVIVGTDRPGHDPRRALVQLIFGDNCDHHFATDLLYYLCQIAPHSYAMYLNRYFVLADTTGLWSDISVDDVLNDGIVAQSQSQRRGQGVVHLLVLTRSAPMSLSTAVRSP